MKPGQLGCLILGGIVLHTALEGVFKPQSNSKKIEVKVSEEKKTLMKFEIGDTCPCGKKVEKWERQGTPIWMPKEQRWSRRCEDCDRDRVFHGDPAEVIQMKTDVQEAV